jgi:hypothetical protein
VTCCSLGVSVTSCLSREPPLKDLCDEVDIDEAYAHETPVCSGVSREDGIAEVLEKVVTLWLDLPGGDRGSYRYLSDEAFDELWE